MNEMNITHAQYISDPLTGTTTGITATIDGEKWSVPLNLSSRRYAEIMRQVEAGELTIEPADTPE